MHISPISPARRDYRHTKGCRPSPGSKWQAPIPKVVMFSASTERSLVAEAIARELGVSGWRSLATGLIRSDEFPTRRTDEFRTRTDDYKTC